MNHAFTTTTFELPGYRTVQTLGVVRGITVRSRSIVGSFVGSLQTIVGGTSPSTPSSASGRGKMRFS